jgi:hypothetical protein
MINPATPESTTTQASRRAAYFSAGYRVVIRFTRYHTSESSVLFGMQTNDEIPFVDADSARAWLAAVNEPAKSRRNGYRVIDHRIEYLSA